MLWALVMENHRERTDSSVCEVVGREEDVTESVMIKSQRGWEEKNKNSPNWGQRKWLRKEARSENLCGV